MEEEVGECGGVVEEEVGGQCCVGEGRRGKYYKNMV